MAKNFEIPAGTFDVKARIKSIKRFSEIPLYNPELHDLDNTKGFFSTYIEVTFRGIDLQYLTEALRLNSVISDLFVYTDIDNDIQAPFYVAVRESYSKTYAVSNTMQNYHCGYALQVALDALCEAKCSQEVKQTMHEQIKSYNEIGYIY